MLFGLYILLLPIYSLQTIYYHTHSPNSWWAYVALATLIYIFNVYYLISIKNKPLITLVLLSILLGLLPYEITIPHVIELLSSSEPKLSGLAEKFPLALGVLIDILFYPILYFIILFSSKKVIGRGIYY